MPVPRRTFLSSGLAVNLINAQPRRRYRTATCGTGWWGMNITREAMASGECEIVAMADVDQNQLDPMKSSGNRSRLP